MSQPPALILSHRGMWDMVTRMSGAGRGLCRLRVARLGEHVGQAVGVDGHCIALHCTRRRVRDGDLDGAIQILRSRADADGESARQLADLLAEHSDLDALRARADTGDRYAALRLARLLADNGDRSRAVGILRARADTGDEDVACQLAALVDRHDDLDEAALIQRAGADDWEAARQLAGLMAGRG